jgi:hypothetical protein
MNVIVYALVLPSGVYFSSSLDVRLDGSIAILFPFRECQVVDMTHEHYGHRNKVARLEG